jgi:hypothetical protein
MEYSLCTMSFSNDIKMLFDPNVWICDTAATCHSTPHAMGFVNLKEATDETTTMGNGAQEKVAKIGDLPVVMCNNKGVEVSEASLRDVQVLPTAVFNLFSGTKLLNNGWKLEGDEKAMIYKKGNATVTFDIKVPTSRGVLYAMYMKRKGEVASVATEGQNPKKPTRITIEEAHVQLGHASEDITRNTAKHLGWELKPGGMKPCEACATAKAKQKNVPSVSEHVKSTENNGRIFLDIATIKEPSSGERASKPHWRIIVDERTGLKFSDFFPTKNGMVEPTCEKFQRWQNTGKPVKIVRMDNAGENKLLEKRCGSVDWKLPIEVHGEGNTSTKPFGRSRSRSVGK